MPGLDPGMRLNEAAGRKPGRFFWGRRTQKAIGIAALNPSCELIKQIEFG